MPAQGQASRAAPSPPHACTRRPVLLQLSEGDQLRTLVLSLCPAIWGHDLIKMGLLLALLGGVPKGGGRGGGGDSVPIRGDAHVLLVGA